MVAPRLCQGRRRKGSRPEPLKSGGRIRGSRSGQGTPEIGDVIMSHKPMLARTTAKPAAERTLAAGSRGPRHNNHSMHQSHELQRAHLPGSDLHPITLIALSTVAWFLAVMWLNFIGSPNVGLVPAVVNGIFVMFLTAILLVASLVIDDPRRKHRFITGSLYCFNSYCCRASGT